MEIIPVIDISGGKVVLASGGDRKLYPQLESVLTQSYEPHQVISDLLGWHPFSTIYIADLDAIEQGIRNYGMYQSLTEHFPNVMFYLDAGIHSYRCWQSLYDLSSIKLVIGSETLIDSEWLLNSGVRDKGTLSLDFRGGIFLGKESLLEKSELWTSHVIVMDLDSVGERAGPNISLLTALQKQSLHSVLIAAGGIRNKHDLMVLENEGINHALMASALHDGSLKKSEWEQWEK